jgi:phosphonate transport system permease protein
MTGIIRKSISGKIAIRTVNKANITINLTLFSLIGLSLIAILMLDTAGLDIGKATGQVLNDLFKMFATPSSSHLTIVQAVYSIIVTLGLGFLTTLLGAAIAVVLGLLSARNLTNTSVSNTIKSIMALIRAIPTVLWVLIFAIGAGLGSVAAVVGMTFHSVAYLVKAYSESFEELDHGVIEALKASGASWLHIVFQAVIPSSASFLLSWTFVRFEINFTTAVAMGAAAASGGIGFDLYQASSFYFNINEVGFITYLILAVAVILEIIATRLKKMSL